MCCTCKVTQASIQSEPVSLKVFGIDVQCQIATNIGVALDGLQELLKACHVLFECDCYFRCGDGASVIRDPLANSKCLTVLALQFHVDHSAQYAVRLLASQLKDLLCYVREQIRLRVQIDR